MICLSFIFFLSLFSHLAQERVRAQAGVGLQKRQGGGGEAPSLSLQGWRGGGFGTSADSRHHPRPPARLGHTRTVHAHALPRPHPFFCLSLHLSHLARAVERAKHAAERVGRGRLLLGRQHGAQRAEVGEDLVKGGTERGGGGGRGWRTLPRAPKTGSARGAPPALARCAPCSRCRHLPRTRTDASTARGRSPAFGGRGAGAGRTGRATASALASPRCGSGRRVARPVPASATRLHGRATTHSRLV